MFSGIVEAVGEVTRVTPIEGATEFTIRCTSLSGQLTPGDSVAVDGACLTVESAHDDSFSVTAVATTLERTIAGDYGVGTQVNLERALRVGDRLDGHFVQGHVDGVGSLIRVEEAGSDVKLHFAVPAEVSRATLAKGSITLNGVSLTVAEGPEGPDETHLAIALIPFTRTHTNLGALAPGSPVNVEGDLIGKYVGRMVASNAI